MLENPRKGVWFPVLFAGLMASIAAFPQLAEISPEAVHIIWKLTLVCALWAASPIRRDFPVGLVIVCAATICGVLNLNTAERLIELCLLLYVVIRIFRFVFLARSLSTRSLRPCAFI